MGEVTKIEWADKTHNHWIGCSKVSSACDNCYAEAMMDHRYGRAKWGAVAGGGTRVLTSASNRRKPLAWNRAAERAGTRPFVFCSSLADVFDNEVDPAWRADLFDLIDDTQHLVWLLLTKRIGNVIPMLAKIADETYAPRNVAFGATMANQEEYDRDAVKLARVRKTLRPLFTFGSFEPLLGPVDIGPLSAPDWIIVGGESGRNARPMQLDWARSLRQQSADLGRVFNFKQVGGRGSDKGGHELDGQTYFNRPAVPTVADIMECVG